MSCAPFCFILSLANPCHLARDMVLNRRRTPARPATAYARPTAAHGAAVSPQTRAAPGIPCATGRSSRLLLQLEFEQPAQRRLISARVVAAQHRGARSDRYHRLLQHRHRPGQPAAARCAHPGKRLADRHTPRSRSSRCRTACHRGCSRGYAAYPAPPSEQWQADRRLACPDVERHGQVCARRQRCQQSRLSATAPREVLMKPPPGRNRTRAAASMR